MSSVKTGKSNKLFIRSEVMAVITLLSASSVASDGDPAEVQMPEQSINRTERARQIKRLAKIEPRQALLDILIKEIPRSASHRPTLQAVCELLMELGDIQTLQTPLWELIKSLDTSDDLKDAANLVLRHLGDASDPDLYLSYLNNPGELISRETERMLGVSASNPEALIDFIDFLFSLPPAEQQSLIQSLHSDYPTDELLSLYIAALLADPLPELTLQMLKNVSQIRTPRAARFLALTEAFFSRHPRLQLPEFQEELSRTWRLAEKTYRLQGLAVSHAENLLPTPETVTLIESAEGGASVDRMTCCMTLPDILGNQGVLIGRQHANGDMMLFCIALNDVLGIVDAFGFQQLAREDYDRIVSKFQEESSKVEITPNLCKSLIQKAEARNWQGYHALPYEYTCWKGVLSGFESDLEADKSPLECVSDWARADWDLLTQELSQFPDFANWFVDEFDAPIIADWAKQLEALLQEVTQADGSQARLQESLTAQSHHLIALLSQARIVSEADQTPDIAFASLTWPEAWVNRLALAASFLKIQGSNTFAQLAATEAVRLHRALQASSDDLLASGQLLAPEGSFIHWIALRSAEEALLKYRLHPETPSAVVAQINTLLASGWPPRRPALTLA